MIIHHQLDSICWHNGQTTMSEQCQFYEILYCIYMVNPLTHDWLYQYCNRDNKRTIANSCLMGLQMHQF